MLPPLIRRRPKNGEHRSDERGFTMALVAVSLLAIIAMAALSIDIGTLYQAKAEAQRAADAAALTAARMISISGITGDPANSTSSWQTACGGANPTSTSAAIKVAQQNLIAGVSVPSASVNVTYGAGKAGGAVADCSTLGTDFGINPTATVTVKSNSLPIFFARVFSLLPNGNYSGTTVSATATAEAYNPSASGSVAGSMIPVQARCVKPWIIPNEDPKGGIFVATATGSINNQGVSELGAGSIGETFLLGADCKPGTADCTFAAGNMYDNPPKYNSAINPTPLVLEYVPAFITGTPGGVPSCTPALASTGYQPAIAGCDQTTKYACGTPAPNGGQVDLTENPVTPTGTSGDTGAAVACLRNSTAGGPDILAPLTYPFQIQAGLGNPLVKQGIVNNDDLITTSNSIVTIPIYDDTVGAFAVSQPFVTIVGFLQLFINSVDLNGNMSVTVMNISGCSNTAGGNPTVAGTSPVPVRLITPP